MKRLLPALIVAAVWLAGVSARPAYAQQPAYRYRSPSRPTLSPYLDYFRRDVGILDPYHTFYDPKQMVRERLSQQTAGIRSLQGQVRSVRTDVQGIREAQAGPTGVGATFMNYSHYYPSIGGRSRR